MNQRHFGGKTSFSESDVTRDDSQRRFLARRFLVFEQDCNHSKQCRNNVATRCYCGKNSHCEWSRVTLPSVAGTSYQMLEVLAFWKR